MNRKVVLFFSKRFLKPKKTIFPNISVIMSLFAIAISISILIVVTSVMNGFSAELVEKILGLNSHITIFSRNDKFNNITEEKNKIKNIHNVKNAFPIISGSGMLVKNNVNVGIFVKGIELQDIKTNKDLRKSLVVNLDEFDNYSIILGKGIARQMKVTKGDEVDLIVPIVAETMLGTFPRQIKMKVVGLINSHSQQYDNYMAIIPFKAGQAIFNLKNNASSIEIIANDPENIFDIENEISKFNKYYISDWKMENSGLLHALKIESNVMSLILGLFVVISVFTIFAVIRMMIKSKERDIAILKAHGVSDKEIEAMFFIVGLTISLVGIIFGNIFGISFALNVDKIRLFLERIFNTSLLDDSIYLLSNLPSRIMITDILNINAFTFIFSLLCTYFSVKRNTKINVVEILRNN